MPRKKFYPTADCPYHVTARTGNKEWFDVPMDYVWSVFSDYLHFIWRAYDVRIHSFVLMSNHFHMLISTPEANLDKAMNYLMREVSKRIAERSGRLNQVFGGPYYWSVIRSNHHYQHAYKYVYRNPVHAGLCKRVEDYKYSTLRGVIGLDYLHIPTYDNTNLGECSSSQLNWLNEAYDYESKEAIQKALKKREFTFPRDAHSHKSNKLESQLL